MMYNPTVYSRDQKSIDHLIRLFLMLWISGLQVQTFMQGIPNKLSSGLYKIQQKSTLGNYDSNCMPWALSNEE